jgi:hypothetical protein
MSRNRTTVLTLIFTALFVNVSCYRTALASASFIYGNNASTSNGSACPWVYKMDPTTLAVLDTYTNLSGGGFCYYGRGGRGTVVVNGILYYTTADTSTVWKYDTATHTDLGAAFVVAGSTGLSAIAYDGTNFWIGDYSGTNKAYLYTPGGTLLNTITLVNCGGNCDGLEYFVQGGHGRLISNRGDGIGPYDIYDTNGTLLTSAFLNPSTAIVTNIQTGIAYDGTYFYTSEINTGAIDKWNGTTGAFISSTAITGYPSGLGPYMEDLSADYAVVLDPRPSRSTTAPVLSTGGSILCALLLLFMGGKLLRRRPANS